MEKIEKIIIVGTGPAGWTAAIYAARADLEPLVIEGNQPGGQLTITTDVDNYPGFPEGVMGPELMAHFQKQAERFGTRVQRGVVTASRLTGAVKELDLEDGTTLKAHAVIIATGASARWLGLPSEKALMGAGVSACATCDAFFFRGKEIVVVGGGDTALEEATFLTKFATKVTIIHRRDELRASKAMQDRGFNNPKIEFIWDSVITEVLDVAAKKVTGVRFKNVKTNEETIFPCDGLFLGIGHTPNTDPFKDQLDVNPEKYINVVPGTSRTNLEGVFAAGDVADHLYRQAITAAGSGCMAAIDAEKYLVEKGIGE
ncbi:MAG: thioredoxin-disulfide reductase [Candidatus Eisenbacteria bacterium]|uniref:Thioredoxin reductase n=1 Tax=Eiseniibacteriota bacterium TaxID=2212470 RepID=A0A948RZM8_UNCEI|nr:thioredoxin-disulfide reductase [Candidatus Eisenbacteria bacterium]MBU2692127.1 thioredoxin-disulfide reductase [Candidatus Eisenbacteria bacterium]